MEYDILNFFTKWIWLFMDNMNFYNYCNISTFHRDVFSDKNILF